MAQVNDEQVNTILSSMERDTEIAASNFLAFLSNYKNMMRDLFTLRSQVLYLLHAFPDPTEVIIPKERVDMLQELGNAYTYETSHITLPDGSVKINLITHKIIKVDEEEN